MPLDVHALRAQFPMLGRDLVYLDTAATAQKPRAVLDAMMDFETRHNAPVHRGVYPLSEEATAAYEGARASAARFVGARADEIVFTRGTTDGINLVASAWGRRLGPNDEIVVTGLEHHSNLVPWQMLCEARGATLRVLPVDERGDVAVTELSPRTRLVCATMLSNALGTIPPVRELVAAARRTGAAILLDAAQAAPHLPIDVRALDCDFLVFSGHKVYGPTGIGVLYGRAEVLAELPPAQGGGEMVSRVTYERATYADPPQRFEAGTPPVAAAVGLGAALEWLGALDRDAACAHEAALVEEARRALAALPRVRVVGDPRARAAVVPFVVDGVHPHDVAAIVAREGICVRAGHLCAQPLLARMGTPVVLRASVGIYTLAEELERLVTALARVREVFG